MKEPISERIDSHKVGAKRLRALRLLRNRYPIFCKKDRGILEVRLINNQPKIKILSGDKKERPSSKP